MEFKMTSPSDGAFLKEIKWNNEEIKAEVSAKMEEYASIAYGENELAEAKKDRAKLNKFREALEAQRISVKKQCLVPYTLFEKQVKEITALVDKPIALIDKKVSEAEQLRKEEKRNQVANIYHDHIGDLKELLPLDRLFQPEYLNASKTIKSIEKELVEKIKRAGSDLDLIETLRSPYEMQLKDKYIQTLDLNAALSEKSRLEEVQRQLDERRKLAEEAEAERRAEKARQVEAEPAPEPKPHQQPQEAPADAPAEAPADREPVADIYRVAFVVRGTVAQLTDLQSYLVSNGITFDVTEKAHKE